MEIIIGRNVAMLAFKKKLKLGAKKVECYNHTIPTTKPRGNHSSRDRTKRLYNPVWKHSAGMAPATRVNGECLPAAAAVACQYQKLKISTLLWNSSFAKYPEYIHSRA